MWLCECTGNQWAVTEGSRGRACSPELWVPRESCAGCSVRAGVGQGCLHSASSPSLPTPPLSPIIFLNSELVFSFQKTEEWEKLKTEADMEEYVWTNSSSEKNILETLLQIKAAEKNLEVNKEELLGTKEVEDYKKCVVSLKNEGDNENTLSQYKESVKRLLNLT